MENIVTLGPLTLKASLRLYARLSPYLCKDRKKHSHLDQRVKQINGRQAGVTMQSRDLSPESARLLSILGGGHPAKILKLACDDRDSTIYNKLMQNTSVEKSTV